MKTTRLPAWLAVFLAALALSFSAAWPVYSDEPAVESQLRLLHDIKYLASDELEGRGVGLKGLDLAADYIRDQFVAAGLKVNAVSGSAFQPFQMNTGADLGPVNTLEFVGTDNKRIELKRDVDYVPQSFGDAGAFSGELAFCGYAIEEPASREGRYDDFAGIDVKGKVVIVMRKTPDQGKTQGRFSGRGGRISNHAELRTKVINAAEKGAAALLFVNDPFSGRDELEKDRKQVAKLAEAAADAAVAFEAVDATDGEKLKEARGKLTTEVARYKAGKAHLGSEEPDELMKFGYAGHEAFRKMPVLHITRAAADRVLKPALGRTLTELEAAIDKDLKPHSTVLAGWTAGGVVSIERKKSEVKNVVGVLEGTGPLADETVVIGAHYDHVGRGGTGSLLRGSTDVHNGADDNASGTVSLIELARRLGARKEKLARRVVFIAFTGEELGLLGSAHYVKGPVFPLEKTIAMINMDMVGRLNDDKLTVFGNGTSPVWEGLLKPLAAQYSMKLTLKPEGRGPSDHQSFYLKQIPVLHFFTGNHSDYHRPSDDWEKINIAGTERIVEMIEKLVVQVADAPERPKYVEVRGTADISDRADGQQPMGDRPYFGSIPDFGVELPGYSLADVSPGGPAEKGGIKKGDRIVQLGTNKIENLQDFDLALRRFSPGDEVDVTVIRGNEKVSLKVRLEKPR